MQNPGFNVQCSGNNKARWGYCANCPSQGCQLATGNDADASIGIGLTGESTGPDIGAGWTEYFASGAGTCSANSKAYKKAWVSVSNETGPGKYTLRISQMNCYNRERMYNTFVRNYLISTSL